MCFNCKKLQKKIEKLEARNTELERENEKLKRRLALYESPHVAPSQRRFPIRRRMERIEARYPGRPRGYPGSTRPVPKPDVVVETNLDRCPECGDDLGEPVLVKRRIVEEFPNLQPMEVIEFLETHYECPSCKAKVIAKHSDCPPDGRFGKNVLVQTTLLKYEERVPLRKIQVVLQRNGLTITPASILDIHRRVSEWLRPEYEKIHQKVVGAEVVYGDETGIKVDGEQYWIWDFVTDVGTLFVIRESRGKEVLEEILGEDFKGTFVCDGWRSYPTFTNKIQRCWVHLLREADDLAEKVNEAKPLSKGLHGIYDRLKISLEDDPPPEERMRLARNAKATLNRWIKKFYKTEELRKFVTKIRNGADHWFTFVTTPGVEPTNNRAERALREHVVQRKIIGTLRNEKGTFIHETITSLLATWKQQGLDPLKMLSTSLSLAWTKS